MGVEYFNQSSGNTGASMSPLFQVKPQVNTFNTYIDVINNASSNWEIFHRLYGWRSGAGNYGWYSTGGTVILSSISSSGVATNVASTALSTILASAGGQPVFHQNSTDQCVYFLLSDGSQLRLCKMNDTTGVFTNIGSAFTPTTISNWPTSTTGYQQGQMFIDTVSGHLKVICNGKFHLLNKTTGAIVSQDTLISLGTFNTTNLSYFTADGVIGTSPSFNLYGAEGSQVFIPRLVHSGTGHYNHRLVPVSFMGSSTFLSVFGTIDSDKLVIAKYPDNANSQSAPYVVLRSDYDKLLQSIYTYYNT